MSSTRLRLLAVPLALLTFSLHVGAAFWWSPVAWRIASPGLSVLLILAAQAVVVCVPSLIYAAVAYRYRSRPAAFRVTGKAFVASSRAALGGAYAIVLMWMTGGLILTERVPGRNAVRIADIDFAVRH